MQRLYGMHERRACTRGHIDIRPRRFSRHSEQNFNDPRYQSRDDRVPADRPIDPDQHHGIPCSLTPHGTRDPITYSAKYVVDETRNSICVNGQRRHAARLTSDLWALPPLRTASRRLSSVPRAARKSRKAFANYATHASFLSIPYVYPLFQRGMRLPLIAPFTRDLPCIQRASELIFRWARFPACITEEFKCREFTHGVVLPVFGLPRTICQNATCNAYPMEMCRNIIDLRLICDFRERLNAIHVHARDAILK